MLYENQGLHWEIDTYNAEGTLEPSYATEVALFS